MRESVKHRLIGTAVLAAVAILFLPSFFKDRQQYQVDTSSHIPGRPSITAVDFNEPEQVDGIEPAPAPETMFIPPDSEALSDSEEINIPAAASATSSAAVAVAVQSSSALSVASPTDKELPEGWVVQVVSLSTQDGANKLRDQLQVEGHRAYVRSVPLENKVVYRVFIGPKQNKAEAIALKTQLDARLKVNSSVLPFKP